MLVHLLPLREVHDNRPPKSSFLNRGNELENSCRHWKKYFVILHKPDQNSKSKFISGLSIYMGIFRPAQTRSQQLMRLRTIRSAQTSNTPKLGGDVVE